MTIVLDFLLPFLAVILIIVMVHELGHFLTARAYRVKVLEFGFGFPPRLLSYPRRASMYTLDSRITAFQSDETVYSLNAFPLGGFVRLVGEDSLELRLLVKCASPEDVESAQHALDTARDLLTQEGSRARVTLLGVEAGPITRQDLQRARKERAEVLGIGVSLEPEIQARAVRSRTKVTLTEAGVAPAEAITRFVRGFATEVQRGLATKGALTRAVILGAGSFMNVALPLAIFAAIFMLPQHTLEGRVQIRGVAPGSPAAEAGIQPGDIVLRVDGHSVMNTRDLAYRIQLKLGKTTTWDILREKQRLTGSLGAGGDPGLASPLPPAESTPLTVRLVPRWRPPTGEGNAGVLIATVDERPVSRSYPFWEAIPKAAVQMGETLLLFRNQIVGMALGVEEAQVAGVVGIAQITGEVARAGWVPTLELMALLSLNLAIINILPIPALDGGRLLFVFLEWVRRGKRISPEREGLVHAVGFAVLITLMVIISYFDVLRIIRGESLLR